MPRYIYFFLYVTFFLSITKSQSNVENIYAPDQGYYIGGFLNLAEDSFDSEIFINAQNKIGLYGNLWIGQIDYYSNTDLLSNLSFGLSKNIAENISFDFGFLSNDFSLNGLQIITEIFIGIDINGFSNYAYLKGNGIIYESWFKPKLNVLSNLNLDLLFYSYAENNGYEISSNISKQLNRNLIGGIILGYESFSDELNYQIENGSKFFKASNTYRRIFMMAYLGFLYQ
tara:strand:+ start:125 stop:808 length:684 start_codon:yes stop_codon:yes gene_type:complete